jgi:hypothetical protein
MLEKLIEWLKGTPLPPHESAAVLVQLAIDGEPFYVVRLRYPSERQNFRGKVNIPF